MNRTLIEKIPILILGEVQNIDFLKNILCEWDSERTVIVLVDVQRDVQGAVVDPAAVELAFVVVVVVFAKKR